ncbi:hypothetical protein NMY22_g1641 [Coprinellus aureogranulatus]|nr:hypothetical protein NMY22_g1641 [Coprinellus aureogranulatus]
MSDIEDIPDVPATVVPSAPGPSTPLTESYTYHSPTPTASGPYILGVDEAGRGPVLGPLVYGVAYCPATFKEKLDGMGFDARAVIVDSKVLKAETRSCLLDILSSDAENLGWSVRVLAPQAISSGMLRRPPTNLNKQSQDATIALIRDVLSFGIELSHVYVDALGSTDKYQAYLSSLFPRIDFTVTQKADSKFKIVSAASIAAKVTRDACVEAWCFEEDRGKEESRWSADLGSGYPSDPTTQRWLKNAVDPVFGFPKLVRFSWTTVKTLLDKEAAAVKWVDEGQANLVNAFQNGSGVDKDRAPVARDLYLSSVTSL